MREKILTFLAVQLILLNVALVVAPKGCGVQTIPEIYIDPQHCTAEKLNETFNITVNIKNIQTSHKMISVQFRVQFDGSLLEAVDAYEGPFMQQFPNTATPPYTYFIKYIEDDPYYGPNVLIGILLLPNATGQWTNFPEGSGTLATITFKAIYRPIEPSPPATSTLKLNDTMIIDAGLNEVPHSTVSGTYEMKPLPKPILKLYPAQYNAILLGELFNVSVDLTIDRDWRLVGVQFRVQFDGSLLEAVDAYEGPFMQQFPNTATPPYTYFIKYIEDDPYYGPNVLIGILLLPNATGQWTNFPEGSGTLATITFKAIEQLSGGAPLQSILQMNDTMLTDDSIEEIPHIAVSGVYTISALSFTYEPLVPSAGEVVTFSVEEPESHVPITYRWDFGDGAVVNTIEPTITHMYKTPGDYNVTLTCIIEGAEASTTRTISIESYPPLPLEIDMDVGSIHFPGEIAEFSILVKHYGEQVDPDMLSALLYYGGNVYANLTTAIQRIDKGLYRISYEIPNTAYAGTYTLLIDAQYYIVKGACIKSFSISSTFMQWNARLLFINGTIATISTDVGIIKTNIQAINLAVLYIQDAVLILNSTLGVIETTVKAINLTVLSIEGSVLKLNSTLGTISAVINGIDVKLSGINQTMLVTIKTSIGNIEGYVRDVDDGGLAIISTELGDVKADLSMLLDRVPEEPQKIDMTPTWIAVVFSVLAFITAIAILMLMLRKK